MAGTGWGGADLLRSQQPSNRCASPPCLRVLALSFRPASIPSPPGQGPVRPGGQTLLAEAGKSRPFPRTPAPVWPSLGHSPPSTIFSVPRVLGSAFAVSVSSVTPRLWGSHCTRTEAPPVGSQPRAPGPHPPQPSLHRLELKGGCRSIRGPGTRAVWPGLALPACPWCRRSGEKKQHLHLALRAPKLSSGLP